MAQKAAIKQFPITLAVHGGAGNLKKMQLTAEQESEYKEALEQALRTGYKILADHGSATDAVEAAVRMLEDCPLFNAGRGSVFTHQGTHEMDAAIMNGKDKSCGAVCGVSLVRNPITLARSVMDKSSYVLLSGQGAEAFARQHGIEFADSAYFHTPERWEQLQKAIEKEKTQLDHGDLLDDELGTPDDLKFGTVGCVALDEYGNLAAATSTGGLTNKNFGRVGDSPLIGSGTYAENSSCAVSCTGKGEDFIRLCVAHDVAALVKYKDLSLQDAADYVVKTKLVKTGGRGGCIALDRKGNIAMPFTTTGMFRGSMNAKGVKTFIY